MARSWIWEIADELLRDPPGSSSCATGDFDLWDVLKATTGTGTAAGWRSARSGLFRLIVGKAASWRQIFDFDGWKMGLRSRRQRQPGVHQ